MEQCPECNAEAVNGNDCFAQLGEIIAWEFDDPDLQREHFLTVATYNLQHPSQFTDEALNAIRSSFISYLDGNMTVAEIRTRHSELFEGSTRVIKTTAERTISPQTWPCTIADVYEPGPVGAVNRVREWARIVKENILISSERI